MTAHAYWGIDPARSAVLSMDCQNRIVSLYTKAEHATNPKQSGGDQLLCSCSTGAGPLIYARRRDFKA